MINGAHIFIDLLFHAHDWIHQERILVFDNYQRCTEPIKTDVV